jgi:putative addiction module CopG family antidote
MNVSLLPEFEELINEKVQCGQYGSSDEVVNAALQLLKERDHAEDRLETLLQKADESRQKVPVTEQLSSRNFVRPRQFTEIT